MPLRIYSLTHSLTQSCVITAKCIIKFLCNLEDSIILDFFRITCTSKTPVRSPTTWALDSGGEVLNLTATHTWLGISGHLLPQQYSGSDAWCHNLMANFILCLILCRSVHLCITNKWRDCMQICNMSETASIRVSDITRAEFKPTSTIKLGRHSSNDPIRISRITVAFWKVLGS